MRPNQYMQGFLVRAVGGAEESDQTPAENLRLQSRPPHYGRLDLAASERVVKTTESLHP